MQHKAEHFKKKKKECYQTVATVSSSFSGSYSEKKKKGHAHQGLISHSIYLFDKINFSIQGRSNYKRTMGI